LNGCAPVNHICGIKGSILLITTTNIQYVQKNIPSDGCQHYHNSSQFKFVLHLQVYLKIGINK